MYIVRGRAENSSSEQRSKTFTGVVWMDPVLPTTDGVTINDVFFTPGAHTHWHHHEKGQILQVTHGTGLVCSAGGEAEVLRPGDTVWVPPGEHHWHGANAECSMLHRALSFGTTTWLDPVSEEDWARAAGRTGT